MLTNLGEIKIIGKLYPESKVDEHKGVCELLIKMIISREIRGFNFSSLFTVPVLFSYPPTYSDTIL